MFHKKILPGLCFFCCPHVVAAQSQPADTAKSLTEVVVRAYEQNRRLIEVDAPVSLTGQGQMNRFNTMSILPALNMTPGVSMEERSPGSYRLNVRGSSLRSPFGVRDVKIYLDDIPLTDPSGNTYLNELSFYNFNSIEMIKGPASSLYGAGIGGAMLIHTLPDNWYKGISVAYSAGSFNTNNINANVKTGDADHENNFNYTHQTSDGYRSQSAMRRDIVSWENLLKENDRQTLHTYMSYSDLYYQTPGGLTLAQYQADPKEARPGTGTQPGAVQNKAAIYQKLFLAGFSNEYRFNTNWQNTTAVYGSYTDFINPGIRVYEIRKEPHFGGRSVFTYKTKVGRSSLQLNFGAEAQQGFFKTSDYGNKLGTADSLQTDDNINLWQYMVFAQLDVKLAKGWTITGGVSLNKSSLELINLSAKPASSQKRVFENKLPPHIALLKMIARDISLYGSIARGFSTPTSAELLRSDGLLGTNLQPEDGTDYEVGARGSALANKLYFDVNVFFFDLKNTIVQRIDTNGVYYYVNAGTTKQHGVETFASYQITDNPHQLISSAKIWISHAWHDFHYGSFKQLTADYSKNELPGAAPEVIITGMDIVADFGGYLDLTYNYTDKIALNDANTSYASSFSLLGARLGFRKKFPGKIAGEVFAGADNLLNTTYSLGNDINAAAGRYYNAAAGRNYFAGIIFRFNQP